MVRQTQGPDDPRPRPIRDDALRLDFFYIGTTRSELGSCRSLGRMGPVGRHTLEARRHLARPVDLGRASAVREMREAACPKEKKPKLAAQVARQRRRGCRQARERRRSDPPATPPPADCWWDSDLWTPEPADGTIRPSKGCSRVAQRAMISITKIVSVGPCDGVRAARISATKSLAATHELQGYLQASPAYAAGPARPGSHALFFLLRHRRTWDPPS